MNVPNRLILPSVYILRQARPSLVIQNNANSSNSVRLNKPQLKAQLHSNTMSQSFYDFSAKNIRGTEEHFDQYKGKVVLVVNTASQCGFTPQFKELESLYKSVNAQCPDKFVVLGFPCNQFGGQDPGSDKEIQDFCQVNYGVTFPIFSKVDVNSDSAHPVFKWLKAMKPGLLGMKRVKWNFEKWLVSKDGQPVERWASTTKPESLEGRILEEIAK